MPFYDLIRLPGDDRYAIRRRNFIEHIFGFGNKYVDFSGALCWPQNSRLFEFYCVRTREECLTKINTLKGTVIVEGYTTADLQQTLKPSFEADFIKPPGNASRLHKICAAFYNGGINQSDFADIYDHFKLDGKVIADCGRCGPDSPINSDTAKSKDYLEDVVNTREDSTDAPQVSQGLLTFELGDMSAALELKGQPGNHKISLSMHGPCDDPEEVSTVASWLNMIARLIE